MKKEPEESVEHMVTVLYCYLGEDYKDVKKRNEMYKRSVQYVKEWVKYRLPKKL